MAVSYNRECLLKRSKRVGVPFASTYNAIHVAVKDMLEVAQKSFGFENVKGTLESICKARQNTQDRTSASYGTGI